MNYSCNMIKDLLPLYYDGACSNESKKIVEEHLAECDSCQSVFQNMQDNTYDEHLLEERDTVLLHHKKNVRKRTLQAGFGIVAALLLICFTVNLAVSHTLDWFFIVLTSTLVVCSLTFVPLVVRRKKRLWTFSTFLVSLLLLLLVCRLYSGGNWFIVTSVSVVLGITVVFLPFVIGEMPLKGFASENKGFILMSVDTILLYLLIIACGFYGNSAGYWRPAFLITTISAAFVWILFWVIRYGKTNGFIKTGICFLIGGIFCSLFNDVIRWIIEGVKGLSLLNANFLIWNTDDAINANCYLLILLTASVIGFAFLLIGILRSKKNGRPC